MQMLFGLFFMHRFLYLPFSCIADCNPHDLGKRPSQQHEKKGRRGWEEAKLQTSQIPRFGGKGMTASLTIDRLQDQELKAGVPLFLLTSSWARRSSLVFLLERTNRSVTQCKSVFVTGNGNKGHGHDVGCKVSSLCFRL